MTKPTITDADLAHLNDPAETEPDVANEQAAPKAMEVVKATSAPVLGERGMEINDFEQARLAAAGMIRNNLVPDSYLKVRRDWRPPEEARQLVTAGILKLRALGLPFETSLAFTYPVGNKIALFSDAVLGLIAKSGFEADHEEYYEGEPGTPEFTAVSRTRRFNSRGEPMSWREQRFSLADAQAAGLLGNENYRKYERRMIMWRARHFLQRDVYSDVLLGVDVAHDIDGVSVAIIGGEQDQIIGEPGGDAERRDEIVDAAKRVLVESGGRIDPSMFDEPGEGLVEEQEASGGN